MYRQRICAWSAGLRSARIGPRPALGSTSSLDRRAIGPRAGLRASSEPGYLDRSLMGSCSPQYGWVQDVWSPWQVLNIQVGYDRPFEVVAFLSTC